MPPCEWPWHVPSTLMGAEIASRLIAHEMALAPDCGELMVHPNQAARQPLLYLRLPHPSVPGFILFSLLFLAQISSAFESVKMGQAESVPRYQQPSRRSMGKVENSVCGSEKFDAFKFTEDKETNSMLVEIESRVTANKSYSPHVSGTQTEGYVKELLEDPKVQHRSEPYKMTC